MTKTDELRDDERMTTYALESLRHLACDAAILRVEVWRAQLALSVAHGELEVAQAKLAFARREWERANERVDEQACRVAGTP